MRRDENDWDHSELSDHFMSFVEESLNELSCISDSKIRESILSEMNSKLDETIKELSQDDIAWMAKEITPMILDFLERLEDRDIRLEALKFIQSLVKKCSQRISAGIPE